MKAQGKLLITGEYFVLDGALALAVPSKLGQSLEVTKTSLSNELSWQSLDNKGQEWFAAKWTLEENKIILKQTTDKANAERLEQIFNTAAEQKSTILSNLGGHRFTTALEFPREWGLGTSSTLISLLSQHWDIDPYRLLAETFGGSGYDIACATAERSILYQKTDDYISVEEVNWSPSFKDQLYFVYQGQKQNSREGIKRYRAKAKKTSSIIDEINDLTLALLHSKTAKDCGRIIKEHEAIVSNTIQIPPVKETRFKDFPGEIKSLGAWGGDFVMVLSPWCKNKIKTYFNTKNCPVVLSFDEMIRVYS